MTVIIALKTSSDFRWLLESITLQIADKWSTFNHKHVLAFSNYVSASNKLCTYLCRNSIIAILFIIMHTNLKNSRFYNAFWN